MAVITVGLAPRKTSFYDPLTNAYITLAKPTQPITFDDTKPDVLKNIVHALLCKTPALVLYEGTLPAAAIEAWEAKFKGGFKSNLKPSRQLDGSIKVAGKGTQALDRAEQLKAGDADLPNAKSVEEVTLFDIQSEPITPAVEEVKTEEVIAAVQGSEETTPAAQATTKNKRNKSNKEQE